MDVWGEVIFGFTPAGIYQLYAVFPNFRNSAWLLNEWVAVVWQQTQNVTHSEVHYHSFYLPDPQNFGFVVHYQAKFSYYHRRISCRFKQCPHLCLGSPGSLVVQTITHNIYLAKHFVLCFTVACSASEDSSCCRGGLGAHCDTRGVLRGKDISLLLLGIK